MPTETQQFIEHLTTGGLENFRKFYSWYRGIVSDNVDPEKRGRIQVTVHSVGQRASNGVWVDPATDYAGPSHGSFWVPEIGDPVWVGFWTGDTAQPHIYLGGWFGDGSAQPGANGGGIGGLPTQLGYNASGAPTKRGWVTKANHSLVFNDDTGNESIEIKWKGGSGFLTIDSNGDISVQNQTGSQLTLKGNVITAQTAAGASVVLDTVKITLTDSAQNTVALDGVATITAKNNSGNSIVLGPGGISMTSTGPTTIQSAGPITLNGPTVLLGPGPNSPLVKFIEFSTLFASHQHLSAVGPTSPPMPQSQALIPTTASIPVIGT